MAAVLLLAGGGLLRAQSWQDAPAYVALFTPAAERGAYRASVSTLSIGAILERLADDAAMLRTPGAWRARRQPPLDAFGRSSGYDRWALARLYGSRQPLVARGSRINTEGVLESWTLISPYPSPDFGRLDPGTLRIIVRP